MTPNPPPLIQDHIYSKACFNPSPNQDPRPCNEISLLVIHNISLPPGEFGGPYIDQLFCNQLQIEKHPYFESIKKLKVSSHILIRRDGLIIQYVPFSQKAWHSGESSYEGRLNCNDFSIGIELEGTDEIPYTKEQYNELIDLTLSLLKTYPQINKNRIVGHCHISPGRKTDPGPKFDWKFYSDSLK